MLRSAGANVSLPIQRLIKEIQKETAKFDRDLRSTHRENLVLPANLEMKNVVHDGFTRNISASGVCIVTLAEIPDRSLATISIYRIGGSPCRLVAECRWTKPFGDSFWISGWQFGSIASGRRN